MNELRPATGSDVWVMAMTGERRPRPFVQTKFNETGPRFSPDSRWLAYVSDETGCNEVYVLPFPEPGRKVRISTAGGSAPVWSRDGRELFYRQDTAMMSVRLTTDGDLSPRTPERLFTKPTTPYFDVAGDGRFLMNEPVESPPEKPIVAILNFLEDLKTRLGPR